VAKECWYLTSPCIKLNSNLAQTEFKADGSNNTDSSIKSRWSYKSDIRMNWISRNHTEGLRLMAGWIIMTCATQN
jgi:hypothetical protein